MHSKPLAHFVLAAGIAATARAQGAPQTAVSRLAAIEASVVRVTAAHPDAIWPGFRPDTIPVLFILPDTGILLVNWPDAALPQGYAPVPGISRAGWQPATLRTAASNATSLGGRRAAQVFVSSDMDDVLLFGTAIHEAFHVFERSVAREGRKFGGGENSFLVSTYPVFDAPNEAAWAFEGRLLSRALAARSRVELRRRAQEYVAAHEARQRALDAQLAEFEQMAGLNEGLAEYALVRAEQLAQADAGVPFRAGAAAEIARHVAQLDSLTANVTLSLRLRFYRTGPAMGLLLDRLAGPAWRADLVRRDLTLEEAVAEASGYRDPERALIRRAAASVDTAALGSAARAGVARLKTIRRSQVDSVLGRPGLTLVLRADSLGRGFGLCGIDPQNLLQVDSTTLLHGRWVRPCGGGISAEFTTASVQDRDAGTFTAVVGAADSVLLTAGGSPLTLTDGQRVSVSGLTLTAPGAALQSPRAVLRRTGMKLEVWPLP